jgi:hypothetical protein
MTVMIDKMKPQPQKQTRKQVRRALANLKKIAVLLITAGTTGCSLHAANPPVTAATPPAKVWLFSDGSGEVMDLMAAQARARCRVARIAAARVRALRPAWLQLGATDAEIDALDHDHGQLAEQICSGSDAHTAEARIQSVLGELARSSGLDPKRVLEEQSRALEKRCHVTRQLDWIALSQEAFDRDLRPIALGTCGGGAAAGTPADSTVVRTNTTARWNALGGQTVRALEVRADGSEVLGELVRDAGGRLIQMKLYVTHPGGERSGMRVQGELPPAFAAIEPAWINQMASPTAWDAVKRMAGAPEALLAGR